MTAHLILPPGLPSTSSSTSLPVSQAATVEPVFRDATFPTPDHFSGETHKCRGFLFQCSLVFARSPRSFLTDAAKRSYIASLLRGRASDWALAFFQLHPIDTFPFSTFQEEFKRTFDHPLCETNAAKRLLNLKQGNKSAAEFIIDFRILAAETGWAPNALQGILLNALNEPLKDKIALREEPATFEELVTLAIRIDNRLAERHRERDTRSRRQPPDHPNFRSLSVPIAPDSPTHGYSSEPMQLGRTRLSPEERLRRIRANECIYCGAKDLFISVCPIRPKDGAHQ